MTTNARTTMLAGSNMRSPILRKWLPGLALSLLPVLNGCSPATSSPPANDTAAAAQELFPTNQPAETADELVADAAPQTDVSAAPFHPLAADTNLPATIRRIGPVADVIKLANAGLDQGVMLAFITNSPIAFNLTPDEIIYLNDLGVAPGVVQAMLQRDQALKDGAQNLAQAPNAAPGGTFVPLPDQTAAAPVAPPPNLISPEPAPPPAAPLPPQPDEVVDATFYGALSPYGNWVDVDGYGPCWQPSVTILSPGWQPYLDGGRWVDTDCGWYWLSDYSWGWAAFHYGRWFQHQQLGWCWAPDTTWAPAWVAWRNNGAYAGWAPLPPGVAYAGNSGLTFHGRPVPAGFHFGLGTNSFAFVPIGHFLDHQLHHYTLSSSQANRLFQQTTVTTGITAGQNHLLNNGLLPAQVAAATRSELRQVALRDLSGTVSPGARAERLSLGGTTLAVFRPDLTIPSEPTVTITARAAPPVPALAPPATQLAAAPRNDAPGQVAEAGIPGDFAPTPAKPSSLPRMTPPSPRISPASRSRMLSRSDGVESTSLGPVQPSVRRIRQVEMQRVNPPPTAMQRVPSWAESSRAAPGFENRFGAAVPTPASPNYQTPARFESPALTETHFSAPEQRPSHESLPPSPPPAPAPESHTSTHTGR